MAMKNGLVDVLVISDTPIGPAAAEEPGSAAPDGLAPDPLQAATATAATAVRTTNRDRLPIEGEALRFRAMVSSDGPVVDNVVILCPSFILRLAI
jgi:hypothetical protein